MISIRLDLFEKIELQLIIERFNTINHNIIWYLKSYLTYEDTVEDIMNFIYNNNIPCGWTIVFTESIGVIQIFDSIIKCDNKDPLLYHGITYRKAFSKKVKILE